MARTATLTDEEIVERLSAVFRDVGYAGASLATLSEATGLKRASLYHRFPDGKEQMAREVLDAASAWIEENALKPLQAAGEPRTRIRAMAQKLKQFYSGGRQACLLNMLSSAHIHEGPFTARIRKTFARLIDALAAIAVEAGIDDRQARCRAERAVMLLQGSLVLSRGIGSTRPFRDFLESLPDELIGPSTRTHEAAT